MTNKQNNEIIDQNIFFDRNDTQNHDIITDKYKFYKKLRQKIDDLNMNEYSNDVAEKRRKVANKFLDIAYIHNDSDLIFSSNNIEIIDEDMLDIGKIEGKFLKINIPPIIDIDIDLSIIIRHALMKKNMDFIKLLISRNIDLFKFEPQIMIICAETDQDELMAELIDKKIHIYTDQYRCVYKLAADGKLNLIKKIMKKYCFPNVSEIINKICIQAIYNNHLNILKYFLINDVFAGLPDHMFCMFINSIQYGHLDIIKFFIDSGISIRQDNYAAVHNAIKYSKLDIIKYFYDIDPTIDNILTDEQKEICNITKTIMMKQYIGTKTPCNISYNEILEGDTYYQCSKNLHCYISKEWIEWCKYKMTNDISTSQLHNGIKYGEGLINFIRCPLCSAPIKRILYVNTKPLDSSEVN
jgi:hypothetical protein